jgi:hypothetical protein
VVGVEPVVVRAFEVFLLRPRYKQKLTINFHCNR